MEKRMAKDKPNPESVNHDHKDRWVMIRVDPAVKREVRAIAKEEGRSVSSLVRFLIQRFLAARKATSTASAPSTPIVK